MVSVELDDLSPEARQRRQQPASAPSFATPNPTNNTQDNLHPDLSEDGTISWWSYATAAWYALYTIIRGYDIRN